MIPRVEEPAYVYRLYDSMGRLLYVGCTAHLRDRQAAHRRSKSWWGQVADWKIIGPYLDRTAAERAECHAVYTEHPRFNADARRSEYAWTGNAFRRWLHANFPLALGCLSSGGCPVCGPDPYWLASYFAPPRVKAVA